MFKTTWKRLFQNTFTTIATILISTFAVIGVISAATTIGTNITTDGNIGIGTASPTTKLSIISDTAEVARFTVASSTATNMYIGSDGNVGIGTTNPTSTLFVIGSSRFVGTTQYLSISSAGNVGINTTVATSQFHVLSEATAGGSVRFDMFSDSPEIGYSILTTRYRGTISSYAAAQDGDNLGNIIFRGRGTSGNGMGARIDATVDGTPSGNSVPGRLTFSTVLVAQGNTPQERMRLSAAGNFGIGTTNPTQKLEVNGTSLFSDNSTTTGKVVLGATAPSANATTTMTFGSAQTANTKGLCLKFFTGGVTIWCYLNTDSPALVCSKTNSCE